ncbi:MAG: hypothetical protein KTR15_05530 [Phycisphaeraceae bacterium]|nr:hypothetical protein [Phycisphaeraceae bacterium]
MDDTPSRQQIDELADLYLTDPAPESPLEGPAPIKLAPKVRNETAPPADDVLEDAIPSIDPVDDTHPMLRLTEDEADEQSGSHTAVEIESSTEEQTTPQTPGDEPAPRAMLEAVVMGNLPGMSGPWLTQYAQLLAQNEGPVVLLHVGEEAIDLELVEPRAEAHPAPSQPAATVRIPPMRGDRTGLVGLIDALVRSETTPARTVLVRFDTINDARTLSRLAAIEDWTLLCGSDDASIAAASQQLQSAVHTDPRLADRSVGIMVMGSDDSAATQATQRIADALDHDLANPVELIGHLRRMQPVQVRDLGSFPDPVALWPKLVGFFDSLQMPDPLQAPEPAPAPTPKPVAVAVAEPQAPAAQAMPRVEPKPVTQTPAASRPEPTPRFRQAKPRPKAAPKAPPQPAPVPAASTPRPAPRATAPAKPAASPPMRPAPAPRVLTPQPELDLVALIAQGPAALDDPVSLDARLPDLPDTQLVVDAQGTVHLLAQHLSEHGDARDAVMQLIEAGQWVTDHLELIALTQRDRDFVDTPPVLHLLSDRADLATQVVGKLAGQIKLHLLQQVQLGRESGWFCTPLG